jgi:hypothetical protein
MTIEQAIQEAIIDKLKQRIVDNNMVATGDLLRSVRYEKNESFGLEAYDILALDYIVGLDKGVAPTAGDNPDWTTDFDVIPSISQLTIWINAKGYDLNPFAVRANIIKFGTSWFLRGGSHIVTDSINAEAFAEVIRLASEDIKIKYKNQWQLLFRNNP